MKTITIAILIVLLTGFSSSVSAFELNSRTDNDRKLMTLASMALIDYQQSVQMFYKTDGFKELNPILGATPERQDLAAFGIVGLGIAYGINELMPEGKFKDFLFDSMLATEQFNIEENQRVMNTGKRSFDSIMLVMSFDF